MPGQSKDPGRVATLSYVEGMEVVDAPVIAGTGCAPASEELVPTVSGDLEVVSTPAPHAKG